MTGSYRQFVSRIDPGCIVILLDRSDSMKQAWSGTGSTLADGAALVINSILLDLCVTATSEVDTPPRHYFDVGIFSYGARLREGGEGVESAFGGPLAGRGLVPLPEIAVNPMDVREEPSVDRLAEPVMMPIWVESGQGYRTPMCEAISVAGGYVFDWVADHPRSFPPIVINITDGMVTDSPFQGAELPEWVSRLTGIETDDGASLFFNVFLSAAPAPELVFPSSGRGLPEPGPMLFDLSSPLPPLMAENARADGLAVEPGARGFAFNASRATLLKVLQIGTRVPDRVL